MQKLTHEEIKLLKPSVEAVKNMERNEIYALLDNVRSLHNVGAIFRTSDAVNLKKLYLCGITGAPPRNEISKTALGAEELVPFEQRDDACEVIRELKKRGVTIIAVELCKESISYDKMDYTLPVCMVFGHEVHGISDEVIALCDYAVKLPMLGRANSLNVATCYGIIMYEVLRRATNSEI